MKLHHKLCVLLLLLGPALVTADTTLTVEEPWIREAPPTASVMAGYMTLLNAGDTPVTVTAISSPDFKAAEIHRTVVEDGVARMLPVSQLVIPANSPVKLEPGGLHLMLFEPQRPLPAGETATLIIHDSNDSKVTATATVIRKTGEDHSHHQHH
jgi:periplasmic copper chaperone A